MRQSSRKEAQTAGVGGVTGDIGEGLPGLQGTVGNSNIVKISVTGADGRGRQLAGSSSQLEEG